MDKERETAKKVREALRTRIELMVDDFSNRLARINTYDYLRARVRRDKHSRHMRIISLDHSAR